LRAWLPPGPRTLVGIGDDAAVLATPDGRVVATTDFLIEGRHFRRDWSSPVDIGHKAAARSLADVAAMGARPAGLLVALAAPADVAVSWLRSLADGLAEECARAGASVIGGDTARADTVILAVTGLGDLAGRVPVLRSGARPGDVVAVAGPLGHAAAGLALLVAGRRAPEALVRAQLRPAPPYDAGPAAAVLGATAMIDISDGLLADLGHIAAASKVRVDVRSAALADPLLADLITTGGITPGTATVQPPELTWILTGGEDHSLAATFPPDVPLQPPWRRIGTVLPPADLPAADLPEAPPSAYVLVDGRPYSGSAGWDHFR
jgi:thiamine-monophosphate kinase